MLIEQLQFYHVSLHSYLLSIMDMRVEGKPLAPGVEDTDDPGLCTKELRVCTERKECFVYTAELEIQKQLHVRFDQVIQLMGECDNKNNGNGLHLCQGWMKQKSSLIPDGIL